MKFTVAFLLFALTGSALVTQIIGSHSPSRLVHRSLQQRAPPSDDPLDINNYLAEHYETGEAPPGFREGDAPDQEVHVVDRRNVSDLTQTAQCRRTIFIGRAANGGTRETGWEHLFDLKQDIVVDRASDTRQPYYEITGRDPEKVKRVVIVHPGLARDSWKYVNLFRNALVCAAANESIGVKLEDVIIAGVAWLNVDDRAAGAATATDAVFSQGQWAFGSISRGPGDLTISSYSVLDALVEHYFDRSTYPNVNQVWVAGHSLGAVLVQHYAMIRKPTRDDPNLNFWTANPGSYAWPVDDRPFQPEAADACPDIYNTWPYGMSNATRDDVPTYRRSDMLENVEQVKQQYYRRRVVYALGLNDHGPGDQHCQARYQGVSHLERGQNMERALSSLPGGKPSSHSFDYIPDTSHQDYPMVSSAMGQWRLFGENLDVRNPRAAATSSSGGGRNGGGGGSSRSGSNSAGAAANRALPPSLLGLLTVVLGGSLAYVSAAIF
ncbi:hypothetical protein V8E36_003867 [Tilletia maclaganii]